MKSKTLEMWEVMATKSVVFIGNHFEKISQVHTNLNIWVLIKYHQVLYEEVGIHYTNLKLKLKGT